MCQLRILLNLKSSEKLKNSPHITPERPLTPISSNRRYRRASSSPQVYLLPDKTKSGKRKTKVKKHTLNPVFDEVLRFYMSMSSLESRTLWLTVWHSDMFVSSFERDKSRWVALTRKQISSSSLTPPGTQRLPRRGDDKPPEQSFRQSPAAVVSARGEGEHFMTGLMLPIVPTDWKSFQSEPFEDVTTYRGDIIVGLKFIPGTDSSGSAHSHGLSLRKFSIKSNSSQSSANNGSSGPTSCSKNTKGSLHIMVKEAKHLSPVKANGNCDAFCKRWVGLNFCLSWLIAWVD